MPGPSRAGSPGDSEARRGAAQDIKLVICDVDGVLTDGAVELDVEGVESKGFSVVDGTGIRLLLSVGLRVGLLSGRRSKVVARRAAELDVTFYHDGVIYKKPKMEEILRSLGLRHAETCYIGDDLIDLPCMRGCGFPVAVADAHPSVKRVAAYITRARGGDGAVRETAELLLRVQGRWEEVLERFFQ